MPICNMYVQVPNKRQKTTSDADERRQPMQDITNTVAHTPALSDLKLPSTATQENATQVFFLDIAVLHAGPIDNECCSVPSRLPFPI